ncbi:MAG: UDP-3-O-(3-hydroxymyristoyl)glucosamine N-acyltransferase [bacterium]|nr:UDP-3-O-(3-hydroxymyristoyl)glucosamine N-acyltransferase [bacterium]
MLLREIASALKLPFDGDGEQEIHGLAGLEEAGPFELSFVTGSRYQRLFKSSSAGAVFAPLDFDTMGRPCLRSTAPYAEFGRATALFYPRVPAVPGVHPSAAIGENVELGKEVSIGALVSIAAGSRIGDRTCIHPHVTIYPNVQTGADCELHSGVHVHEGVRLGDRVTIQSGSVIGGQGFGFAVDAQGRNTRIPHTCPVLIGDDCDIGANVTIDASHPGHLRRSHDSVATRLGNGVKLDNQVHIGHGCEIGDSSVLCAKVGLAGGTSVGRGVYMGGTAIAAGHLHIGDLSLVGAGTGVSGDLEPGSQVLGSPHMERRLWGRWAAARKRLPELLKRVKRIEDKLEISQED